MASDHRRYRFSATLQTQDVAVLHCLRGLCQQWSGGPYPQIGWGGTKRHQWNAQGGKFTFRFTDPPSRTSFLADAKRLLAGHWVLVAQDDNDPATPRR